MTHFQRGGVRTPSPESLTALGKARALLAGVRVPRPENHRLPTELGLPFEVRQFPGAHGLRLEAWRVQGAAGGPVVLLFHGYAACKESLLAPARVLFDLGCTVWLVDFHGSGGSEGDTTSIGFDEAEDVIASFEQVRSVEPPSRPVVLLGESLGAAAVLRATSLGRVNPDGLILECPFDRLTSTVGNRFRLMHLPSFPFAPLLVFWGGVQQGFNGFTHNPVEYARVVTCPTLLMHGDQDSRVTFEQARAIARALGNHGQFHVWPGLAHESYEAREPVEWRRLVGQFLRELPARR
jgi:alpha-beta hydrolase superfamily lysophospholipase